MRTGEMREGRRAFLVWLARLVEERGITHPGLSRALSIELENVEPPSRFAETLLRYIRRRFRKFRRALPVAKHALTELRRPLPESGASVLWKIPLFALRLSPAHHYSVGRADILSW